MNRSIPSRPITFPSANGLIQRLIKRKTIVSQIEKQAIEQPNTTMLIFEGRALSWSEFNKQANQYAYAFLQMGLKKGDSVALMMENRIEYLTALIGLTKIGIVAGLINHNLSGSPLVHCIAEISARKIIFGEEVSATISAVKDEIAEIVCKENGFLYVHDKGITNNPTWSLDFGQFTRQFPKVNPPNSSDVFATDRCCYIYTSGTTGMPKASIIKHDRWYKAGFSFSKFALRTKKSDRYYLCLPLFHSSALFIGFGSAVVGGASIFLRRRFSASHFLEDAREHETNTFIYIGEICRYLLHKPTQLSDANNPIVKCAGNGLRPDVWAEFKERYGISRVAEFYGSTEGNIAFMNCFNNNCTIGVSPSNFSLVKYDVMTDEVVRYGNGFCSKVEKGEPGLLIAKINELLPFEGYTNKEATEKKILRNVFKQGDAYFNSGDLIKQVSVRYSFGIPHYQFVDRVGDTFRWKGENVSTNEVEEVINSNVQIKYSNVYGVELEGTNGRAGMVALTLNDESFDVENLASHISRNLPSYAQPIFIRILSEMDTTGTFKMLKGDLKKQAYHPERCDDPVFVRKPGVSTYEPLSTGFYNLIASGNAGY